MVYWLFEAALSIGLVCVIIFFLAPAVWLVVGLTMMICEWAREWGKEDKL